jgi:hypothetical protein
MTSIVFFSHRERQCGVHQFGKQIFAAISRSSQFNFIYCEIAHPSDVRDAVLQYDPAAVLINFHPATIGWIAGWPLWSLQVPTIGIMHEMTAALAERTDDTLFDYYIYHDPSAKLRNPRFFTAGRLIGEAVESAPASSRVTIGSFGFATAGKGFEAVAARAHAEFDDCLIRFNIPSSDFSDKDGSEAHRVADRCRSIIYKPGIDIEITHDFMDLQDVKAFLAGNSLNAFFYDEQSERGISSAIDVALAARRPIAARHTSMVRHLFDARPSIFIEERSLREIVESGISPLQPYIDRWTADNMQAEYENIVSSILDRESAQPRRMLWHRHTAKLDVALAAATAAADAELAAAKQDALQNWSKLEEFSAQNTKLFNDLRTRDPTVADLQTRLEAAKADARANLASMETLASGVRMLELRHQRLTQELQLDEGPLALRTVLPFARVLRRAHLTIRGQSAKQTSVSTDVDEVARSDEAPNQASPLPLEPVSRDASVPLARPSWLHRAGRRATLLMWRLVGPVMRPLLWRGRGFLTASLQGQLASLQGQLASLQGQLASLQGQLAETQHRQTERLERLGEIQSQQTDRLEQLREVLVRQQTDPAALAATLQLIEAVLLSLAASNRQ